ncbi:MAG: Ig-like domain-containing protein, partial [Chryseolinea sp.]
MSSLTNPDFAFTTTGGGSFENQGITLVPGTDPNRATMIRSSIWGGNANLMLTSIPSGIYDIYTYAWEDNSSITYNLSVEGSIAIVNYNSGSAGSWVKHGPFRKVVSDGTINISSSGTGSLSGVEIRTVPTNTVPVTAISISPSPFSVVIGKSAQMSRTISPANASNKNVLWTSSNTSVALVNGDGWVTGVSIGTATITATINGFSSQATVNITNTPSSYSTRLNGT